MFRRNLPLPAAATLLVLLAACADHPTGAGPRPEPRPLGLVEVTISGIGTEAPRATASSPGEGPRLALTRPTLPGGATGSGIQLRQISSGSITEGVRGAGGVRYVWSTFAVRNADPGGTAYDTPRQNLTFVAVATSSTLGQTAVTALRTYGGTAASGTVAPQVVPAGAVYQRSGRRVSAEPDVLQLFAEEEVAALPAISGVTPLAYGFVARHAATNGRILPASPAPDQYDGVVTFAFRFPLQATAADDPFTVSLLFLALDDSETRLTQSLEEQDAAAQAAFAARADEIGATRRVVLPGSTYEGPGVLPLCRVRTAGTAGSPTAFLVDRAVGSVQAGTFSGRALRLGGGLRFTAEVRDAQASLVTLPVAWTSTDSAVVRVEAGVARAGRTPGSAEVRASACGVQSAGFPLRVTGVAPTAGGYDHSLAVRADGTVAAWGSDLHGESTVPEGLQDVVGVAAGGAHSLALRSDGTVVGWGLDRSGQATPPPGLTGVVQVAATSGTSMALRSDGTVVGWGGSGGALAVPAGLSGVVQLGGSTVHVLALKEDGTVVAWGLENGGQLDVPPGLTDVVQVAGGLTFSVALRADGTVVSWGQIGVPASLHDVVAIAAGDSHALALQADGSVVEWRTDGTVLHDPIPGSWDVLWIGAGQAHSLAVAADGGVLAWGSDDYGQSTVPPGLAAMLP